METKSHKITEWELQVINALDFLPEFCLLLSLLGCRSAHEIHAPLSEPRCPAGAI